MPQAGTDAAELFDEESGRWATLPHPMAQPRASAQLVSLPASALLQAAACMPDDWLRGRDGGCQILVSNRHGEGGMMGSGYAPCDGSFAFCTEQPTPVGENSWRIPVSAQHSGWFVTAETGEISGGGEATEGCLR